MRNRHLLAAVAALMILSTTAPARADSYIITNTTINTAVLGSAYVGYGSMADIYNQTNPSSPTVNFVAGGSVPSSLYVYNNSVLNMSGGSVTNTIELQDNSLATITGGMIGLVSLNGTGTLNFSGANTNTGLQLNDGTANITGGSGSSLTYSDTVNLYGGSFGGFYANGGTLNIYGTGLSADLFSGRPDYYVLHGTLEDGTSIEGDILSVVGGTTLNFFEVPAAVPEPSSLAMCGLAELIGTAYAWRRRKRAA